MQINCVSISLGSSKRDKETSFLTQGIKFNIVRLGTDGNIILASKIIEELQNLEIHSIGLGGIDLLLFIEDKFYVIEDAKRLYDKSKKIPVVDGSITKRILEKQLVKNLINEGVIDKSNKVLVVSSLDRFESLKVLYDSGFEVLIGDFVFALEVDKIIRSIDELKYYAKIFLDDVLKLPFSVIYPIGESQGKENKKILKILSKYDFDVVIGDFHYVRKIGSLVKDKVVITNTLTSEDIEFLKLSGVKRVISSGVMVEDRSFGANVMDCLFSAYCLSLKNKKVSPFDSFNQEFYSLYSEFFSFLKGVKLEEFRGNRII